MKLHFVSDVVRIISTTYTPNRMNEEDKQLVPVEQEISRETETLFRKIRATLKSYPPRKQPYGIEFEIQFAQVCGSVYAISTYTASVLRHVLQSMDLSEGDEVLCPAWIRPEYIRSILASKLVPVFCEISPYTLGLDCRDVSHKLSARSRVVLLSHTFGIPADLDTFSTLCKQKKLRMIEVVPCELGSKFLNKTLGTFGSAGIIEYHPQHCYSTQDACILLTDIESVARRVRSMSFYEQTLGTFSELQGALGLWDLSRHELVNAHRKGVAYRFDRAFEKVHGINIFHEHTVSQWGHQLYPIRVSAKIRDELYEKLIKAGVAANLPQKPAHLHSYIQTRLRPPQLLLTERINREVILLPTMIEREHENEIIDTVQDFFRQLF